MHGQNLSDMRARESLVRAIGPAPKRPPSACKAVTDRQFFGPNGLADPRWKDWDESAAAARKAAEKAAACDILCPESRARHE